MKDKVNLLINKIKPWIKTKRAWIEIALSVFVIVCVILAFVYSSKGRMIYTYENSSASDSAVSLENETEHPDMTATPIPSQTTETVTPVPTPTPPLSSNTESTVTATPTVQETQVVHLDPGPTGPPFYTPVPEGTTDTKAEAYRTVIESCSGNLDYSYYCLYDMDSDGVEELIVRYGMDDTNAKIDIYTYINNELILVGDTHGTFAHIAGDSEGGIIVYYHRVIDGLTYEAIDRIEKIETDIMIYDVVFSAQVDTYTVLDTNVDIPLYKMNDFSPLS